MVQPIDMALYVFLTSWIRVQTYGIFLFSQIHIP